MRIRALVLALATSAGTLVGLLALTVASAVAASPPIAITGEATEVKRARATLAGNVRPEGESTVYYFEYGTDPCSTATCGTKTPTRGPVTEEGPAEPFKLTRLKPGTTYHFWLVASSAAGTAHGEEMTFTTLVSEKKEYIVDREGSELSGYSFASSGVSSSGPVGVAVNSETGGIYVSSYDETPSPEFPTSIAQFNSLGVFQASAEMPTGHTGDTVFDLAVDNSSSSSHGSVYVADVTMNAVYKFTADGKGKLSAIATPIGEGILNAPIGVAVDSGGDIYVANEGSGTVAKFSPQGTLLAAELVKGLSRPLALAIDSAGNIYVTGSSGTVEYSPAGVCVESGCVPIDSNEGQGVAIDGAGDVFISDGITETVREYGAGVGHPLIMNIALEQKTTFPKYPRYLAVNDSRQLLYATEANGAVRVFKHVTAKPVVVKTEPATQVDGDTAETLNGTVNPGGLEPAEYFFEYDTSPCLAETCGTVVAEQSQVPLTGDKEIPVSVHLDNLAPNTTYHAWLVGVNEESGVEHGEEVTFTTGSVPPTPPGPAPEGSAPTSSAAASEPAYPLLTSIVPVPGPREVVKKTLTRTQRLAKALAACNHKPKKQRASCKRQARRTYGPVTKGVAKKKR